MRSGAAQFQLVPKIWVQLREGRKEEYEETLLDAHEMIV